MRNNSISFWLINLLLIIGTILFFIGGPDYYSTRSLKYLWDIGHILYFALLTILLLQWKLITHRPLIWQWLIILAITLVTGVSIEILQLGSTRTPDMGDVVRDLTGSLLVLSFWSLSAAFKMRLYIQSFVTVLTLILLWPLTKSIIDETIAWQQFPLLSAFETPFEIERWSGKDLSIVSIAKVSDRKLLKIFLTTDRYSGVALKHFDGIWKSFSTLEINLYNPDITPLQITIRINDRKHNDGYEEYEDRYNRSFKLVPGWNLLEINLDEVMYSPADRVMDMSHISGFGFFTVSLPSPRTIYLDKVQLTY